jgi:hypothetical protein
MLQLREGRHFVNEQPDPSNLYQEEPWPKVLAHPSVVSLRWHRCQTGLKVGRLPAKKASRWVASHPLLIQGFEGRVCNNRHQHASLLNDRAKACQVWTWEEAQLLISGICALKRHLEKQHAYPEIGVGPDEPERRPSGRPRGSRNAVSASHRLAAELARAPAPFAPRAKAATKAKAKAASSSAAAPSGATAYPHKPKPPKISCPGCDQGVWKHSWRHTRVLGVCRHPLVETIRMNCPACDDDKEQDHKDHTLKLGDCRWAVKSYRQFSRRPTRLPGNVKEPREKARAEATANMQPSSSSGELGAADEAAAEAASPSSPPASAPLDKSDEENENEDESSPSGGTRKRKTWKDTGSGPEHPADWSGFDVGRVVRSLIKNTEAARRRILRKLHVRWWHSSAATMKRLLTQAGVPGESCDLIIDEIVDTCSVCRMWAKPLPESVASTSIAEKFNEMVESEIVF